MSEFWKNLLIQLGTNAVLIAAASLGIKFWIQSIYDKRIEKFKSTLDRMSFVSTALYKNREQMIFEFDRCLRGLMGHWHCLVAEYPNTKKEFGFRWKEILRYHEELQSSHFKSRLVFPDDLLELSEEIFKLIMDTHQTGRKVAHFHSVRLDYKYDDETEFLPANIPQDVFEKAKKEIAIQAAHINNDLIPKWEKLARLALNEHDLKPPS